MNIRNTEVYISYNVLQKLVVEACSLAGTVSSEVLPICPCSAGSSPIVVSSQGFAESLDGGKSRINPICVCGMQKLMRCDL